MSRSLAFILTLACGALASRAALAQDPTPEQLPPPAPPPPGTPSEPPPAVAVAAPAAPRANGDTEKKGTDGAPPAHAGFQIAARTGVAIPFGNVAGGGDSAMSDYFSPQVPITVDIGGKPIPELFIGAYIGLGFGGAAGKFAEACSRANASCVAAGFRIGVEAAYHLAPDSKMDPWFGYGIGFAGEGVSGSANGRTTSLSLAGPEYGHFMGGLDFRIDKTFGIGPMIDFGIGKYTRAKSETIGLSTEGDVKDTALHEWLTLGVRVVILP